MAQHSIEKFSSAESCQVGERSTCCSYLPSSAFIGLSLLHQELDQSRFACAEDRGDDRRGELGSHQIRHGAEEVEKG
jgi:hypothetical protein